jgi:hypothetical protein
MHPEDVPPDRKRTGETGRSGERPPSSDPHPSPYPEPSRAPSGPESPDALAHPPSRQGWEIDPAPTLRRSVASLPVVGGLTAAAALAPLPESVSTLAVILLPLVFLVAFSLDLLDDAADRYPLLDRVVGRVAKMSEKGGESFYGSVAAAEFLRREFFSLRDALGEATSITDFVFSELLGFGLETVFNVLWSGIWPFAWSMRFGWANVAMVAAGAWVVWALGRWTLVEREVAPPHPDALPCGDPDTSLPPA